MRFLSLFSGIGGFDLGLERAGHECVGQVEIDGDCRRVLARHFRSDSPRLYPDVRTIGAEQFPRGSVDLVAGGFPCQDLSVAGKRAGLAGERSGLWHEFHRILAEVAPRWVLIENVPGLLSSHGGRDFAIVLRGLVELGYGVAWRVLDSQYFGVPQRRRRVFVVGCLGDAAAAAQVLFEPESCSGNPAPSRTAGQDSARESAISTLQGGGKRGYRIDAEAAGGGISSSLRAQGNSPHREDAMTYVAEVAPMLTGAANRTGGDRPPGPQVDTAETLVVAKALLGHHGRIDEDTETFVTHTLRAEGHDASEDGTGRGVLDMAVRRLTPLECARLQAFPDDWLDGLNLSDSARYRMLGNAITVSVAEWIGNQLMEVV